MEEQYITPLNLSKLGFRYFRIILESKMFSRKFIEYVVNHPNTGYVFEGTGWSGKKRLLVIGIWATTNAEITDIATHIRSIVPDSYKVVYQSELTRLEYYRNIAGERKMMILLDELDQKQTFQPIELQYLKLLSVDGSLSLKQRGSILNLDIEEVKQIDNKLKQAGVFYGTMTNGPMPENYTKYFIDTASLSNEVVESLYKELSKDEKCVYLARGNGKYNIEFEYLLDDEAIFLNKYSVLLKNSKKTQFDTNYFTNLFPQSKSLNTKAIQNKFVELAKENDTYFDFRDSALWYLNQAGAEGYLSVYSEPEYEKGMIFGEVSLFSQAAKYLGIPEKKVNLIDLGSGNGYKAQELIKSLGEDKIKSYFPVDIQELELAQALRTHKEAKYNVHPTIVSFDNLSTRFPLASSSTELNLYAILGGTYGNFPVSKINKDLAKILKSDTDRLLVTMPIRDYTSRQQSESSYLAQSIEGMTFGVLQNIGFTKDDFESNAVKTNLKMQIRWENNRQIVYFVLKSNKLINGVFLEAGTKFDTLTSWKPTLSEFKQALEQDFEVEEMISNKAFAFAVCKKK